MVSPAIHQHYACWLNSSSLINFLFLDRPGPDEYARERGRPIPRDEYNRYIGPLDDDLAQRREEYARQRMREEYGRPSPREGYRDPEYRRDPRDAPPTREPMDARSPATRDPRDERPPPGRDYRDWDRSREMYNEPRPRDVRVVSDRGGPGGYGERRMSPPREWPRAAEGDQRGQGGGQDPRETPASGGESARPTEGERRADETANKGEENAGR